MKTEYMLLLEFETTDIPLADICEKYFSLGLIEAKAQASRQSLPVPVFRGGSQKSQWLISVHHLAKYLDAQKEQAEKDWKRINAA